MASIPELLHDHVTLEVEVWTDCTSGRPKSRLSRMISSKNFQPLFRHALRLESRPVVLAPGRSGLSTRRRHVYRQRRRLAIPLRASLDRFDSQPDELIYDALPQTKAS